MSRHVSLRDESFGALAYHHVNRRLVFLKSKPLVAIVRDLGTFPTAREAIAAAGRRRAVASGYSNDARLKAAFATVQQLFPDPR